MQKIEFAQAKPVWIAGRETEMNLQLEFTAAIEAKAGDKVTLAIATSGIYNAFVNGTFAAYGPARAGRGFFYAEELDLTRFIQNGKNTITIEVVAHNVNSYMLLNEPAFLTAELMAGDRLSAATGLKGDSGFGCRIATERVQKVQRYSFQRPFIDVYRFGGRPEPVTAPTDHMPERVYYARTAPMPEFESLRPAAVCSEGSVDFSFVCEKPRRDRSLVNTTQVLGFDMNDLEVSLSEDMQNMAFKGNAVHEAYDGGMQKYDAAAFKIYEMPYNGTGLIAFTVETARPVTVTGMFDELLRNGDVDPVRMSCCNGFRFILQPGRYDLMTHDVYTFKYLKFVTDAECAISNIRLVEVKHPPVQLTVPIPADKPKLRAIYDAAVETFRQNAVDIFMDCPSRERAGWLCDSFFTSRVEHVLTGGNAIEHGFLYNFILADNFEPLPPKMLPMCYPGENPNKKYIPNWAMWFVCELHEHLARTGDTALIAAAGRRVLDLVDFFAQYENDSGLLEKLDSWVFIEWSKANELTQDVNYPSNMLYCGMLEAAGELYGRNDLLTKASKLKETIRKLSFNGDFFTDNAKRGEDGALTSTGEATEVCQYYAFFFGIATPESYPQLWRNLVEKFGPDRKQTGEFPQIWPANAFIGNYLRLDILQRYGYDDKLLENIEGYFYGMAVKTGTLWENDTDHASCNHGFASHVACWLANIYGTRPA